MNGIDHIQVINLDRRPDRLREFQLEAQRVGLDRYERFSAVDGKELAFDSEISKIISMDNDFHWRCGVSGCILSHVRLWQNQVSSSIDWTLILEEDVRFRVENLNSWWEAGPHTAFQALQNIDLIYLGGCPQDQASSDTRYKSKIGNGPFWYCSSEPLHLGAYSYLLSLSGAKKLLRMLQMEPVDRAIDWWLIDRFSRLQVALLRPFIATSPLCYKSDIQGCNATIPGAPSTCEE